MVRISRRLNQPSGTSLKMDVFLVNYDYIDTNRIKFFNRVKLTSLF